MIPPRYRPLFRAIVRRQYNRVNVLAPTQDGKSLTIAAAVTLVAATQPEKFTILAPSEKKADVIMTYVRDFATQHPLIYSQLELDPNEKLNRLKRERSRRHLTFLRGGGVQTLTLDAKNGKRSIEAAMGFGGKNLIEDEASLIDDPLHSTVMRMMGGYKRAETFLLKIGNPFYRNHFFRSSEDANYHQIRHDWRASVADLDAGFHGFDPAFIEEMRSEWGFDVFYDCLFPPEDKIDAHGFRQLLTSTDIKRGEIPEAERGEKPWIGGDIGGGGDKNVYWIRYAHFAFVAAENQSDDTMTNVTVVEELMEKYGVPANHVNLDDIGIGRGVRDRLREKGHAVNGVAAGAPSRQPLKYANLNAEMAWKARLWLTSEGNVLRDHPQIKQFLWAKYKTNTDKCLMLEPKDQLKKRTGKSPDHWDAFKLTFYSPPVVGIL